MTHASPPDGHGDIGTVGEEAAKLLGALADWAREHTDDVGAGVTGGPANSAAAPTSADEHPGASAAECTYCPICRTLHVLRHLSPEVKSHLSMATASLASAMAAVVAPSQHSTPVDVERIRLDDEVWPD